MSSLSTLEELRMEAIALGIDFSTPSDDGTPLSELQDSLEILSIEVHSVTPQVTKRLRLEDLEASSTYLTCAPEDNECAICVTELVAMDPKTGDIAIGHQNAAAVKLDACGHAFHAGCMLEWLKTANTCPFCRRGVCEEAGEANRRDPFPAWEGLVGFFS